jgi:hypothetical protein
VAGKISEFDGQTVGQVGQLRRRERTRFDLQEARPAVGDL